MNSENILIVGAGISGATLAERFAAVLDKKVFLIDKRDHVGGNCYDHIDENGFLVPAYGPHYFHTNDETVWSYVRQFGEWIPYEHRVLSYVDGRTVPVPVNIETVNKMFGLSIATSDEMDSWLERNVEKIIHPENSEEAALAKVGKVLYEKMFRNYTKKQWDRWPAELDASIMDRIPVRNNFDDRYFSDQHQAMPRYGYAKLFDSMLDHQNIEVLLGVDYFQSEFFHKKFDLIIFTGKIDEFFRFSEGERLEYRSLKFKNEVVDKEFFQDVAQVNYPNDDAFTRISEPKHATGQKAPGTVIIKEYPTWEGEPYYPVLSPCNNRVYQKYAFRAQQLSAQGIYFVGRLAQYRYLNMDQAFKNALDLFDNRFLILRDSLVS